MADDMQDEEFRRRFDRLETKMDDLPDRIHQQYVPRELYDSERTTEREARVKDRGELEVLKGRVTKVERLMWFGVGAAAALGSAAGSAATRVLGG